MIVTRVNRFELRLVNGGPELAAAQALRYAVFYEEMGARASPAVLAQGRDFDRFDEVADHFVVVDLDHPDGPDRVVGCYRVLRESVARRHDGFYTSGEFDIAGVRAPYGEIMELGRSCVDAAYRVGPVMQLLWRGVADYADLHDVGLLLGCASLPGTDVDTLAPILSYLHHHHLAAPGMRPRALPERFVRADRLPPEEVNEREVQARLPPLLKGYLRLGGMVGDGAVIDAEFNTTDVCLVVPTALVRARNPRLFREMLPRTATAVAA